MCHMDTLECPEVLEMSFKVFQCFLFFRFCVSIPACTENLWCTADVPVSSACVCVTTGDLCVCEVSTLGDKITHRGDSCGLFGLTEWSLRLQNQPKSSIRVNLCGKVSLTIFFLLLYINREICKNFACLSSVCTLILQHFNTFLSSSCWLWYSGSKMSYKMWRWYQKMKTSCYRRLRRDPAFSNLANVKTILAHTLIN